MKNKKILNEVNSYYTDKIIRNGLTPQGVDWNSTESQEMRFDILSENIDYSKPFSVLDYGCGYGSMFDFYKTKELDFMFYGFDISEEMIRNAKETHKQDNNAKWFTDIKEVPQADFVIASGIFNVRLENSETDWLDYILETLKVINEKSVKGFSFNMLTKYSDAEYMKDYLYYADPLFIFDHCKRNFSKWVALKHDYPLYEFSISVKK
ncbi:MAG: nucleotide binding motif containing protein [Bacteroidetes bacterium]|jgi:SAM-dependent methyltransferase|nr:nucleotide binding motif containing protein [Bacteroidota bacterium]